MKSRIYMGASSSTVGVEERQFSMSPKRTMCGIALGNYFSCTLGAFEDRILDSSCLPYSSSRIDVPMQTKCLLGIKFSDPELQSLIPSFPFSITEDPGGFPLVTFFDGMKEKNVISPIEIITTWLSQCKDDMVRDMGNNIVSDCCIGIPVHFTHQQRMEVLRAASMAGWKPHRLFHETIAAALAYRFYCSDIPHEGELNTAFIDVGYSSMQVSIVELKQDQLKVLSHAHDKSIGGRAFDLVLFDHFLAEFNIDISEIAHSSSFSLLQSCERLKIELSNKTVAKLQFESMLIDNEARAPHVMTRDEFEKLNSTMLEKVKVVLQKALKEAKLDVTDVTVVELAGLGSKMPAIINILKNFFKKEPRSTNTRPVAGGCLIDCSMLCLAPKLPKFQIIDILPYSIGLSWKSGDKTQKQGDIFQVVFPKGSPIPSVKNVTFRGVRPFLLDLACINEDDSKGLSQISRYEIDESDVSKDEFVEVNVRVGLNLHGISYIESATVEGAIATIIELPFEDFQYKNQKAEKERADVSMQLKTTENALDLETKRRIEVEKCLQYEKEHTSALELQLEESKALIERTIKQQKEMEATFRDKLKNSLNVEIMKRTEAEKILKYEKEHTSALELQLEESQALIERTRKQQEEIENTFRDKLENSLNVEIMKRTEAEKILQDERTEQKRLHDIANEHRLALERELEDLKRHLETTKKQMDELQNENDKVSSHVVNSIEFTFAELKEATNNFDKSFQIGEGGFGYIYRGFLRHTTVAIKMPKAENCRGDAEFNQEVEILTKIRHPNLVSLIGTSPKAWALIYEFLPNGSLDTFLTNGQNPKRELSWQNRIRIASEVCSALIFLHSVQPHGIAHGDLKPANVLLDSNLVSKLSDFGISRILYQTENTNGPVCYTNPKGTMDYIDPEYLSSGVLTPQSDVYSFGVILLQFVTGREATKLRIFVEEALNGRKFEKIVDNSAGNWPIKLARKLAFLGVKCSDPVRKNRPNLTEEVWLTIESIKCIAGLGS